MVKIKLKLGRPTPPPPPRDYEADEKCVAESLLLLSHSFFFPSTANKPASPAAAAPPAAAVVELRYTCDVCGTAFETFHQLGGHKTAHRPKHTIATLAVVDSRFHDCSECGDRFLTGQALGGHKRKHYQGPIIGPGFCRKSVKLTSSSSGSPARDSSGASVSKDGGGDRRSHERSSGMLLGFDLNLPYTPGDFFLE